MNNKNIITIILTVISTITFFSILVIGVCSYQISKSVEKEKILCSTNSDPEVYTCDNIEQTGLFDVKYEVTMASPLWDIYMLVNEAEFKKSFTETICNTNFIYYGADIEVIINGSIEEELFNFQVTMNDCN